MSNQVKGVVIGNHRGDQSEGVAVGKTKTQWVYRQKRKQVTLPTDRKNGSTYKQQDTSATGNKQNKNRFQELSQLGGEENSGKDKNVDVNILPGASNSAKAPAAPAGGQNNLPLELIDEDSEVELEEGELGVFMDYERNGNGKKSSAGASTPGSSWFK